VLKDPAPHGFNMAKGSTHMAVTRAFVEFAVHDLRAQSLLDWMSNIRVSDEFFFQTLNHNPQMNIPGSFKGRNTAAADDNKVLKCGQREDRHCYSLSRM